MDHSLEVHDGVVAMKDWKITYVGETKELLQSLSPYAEADVENIVNAKGKSVIPGFIDAHTHLPFYGWRDSEVARGREHPTEM